MANVLILSGRLGKDPEVKFTQSGDAVCTFPLAVSTGKDKPPMWVDVVAWGKQAETHGQYLKKGREVVCVGQLVIRSWEDKEGKTKYKTEMKAFTVEYGAESSGRSKSDQQEDDDDSVLF